MASSSSSSNLALVGQNVDDNNCGCGFERYERTSWTPKNPARHFWNCPNSLLENVPKCKYFVWKDNKLHDKYYKDVILGLKADLDEKEKASEVNKCMKKLYNLQVLRENEKPEFEKEKLELEKVIMEVRAENARLRKIGDILKKMVMVLMVIVGVCFMVIWYG